MAGQTILSYVMEEWEAENPNAELLERGKDWQSGKITELIKKLN